MGLIEWIESELVVGQGLREGQPFLLYEWQKKFIRNTFQNSEVTISCLSVGRSAGKSTLCSTFAISSLIENAPLQRNMCETSIIASSFSQGLVIFKMVLFFARKWLEAEPRRYTVQNSINNAQIIDRETGSSVRTLGSDNRRLHGLQSRMLLCDEIAQWETGKILGNLSAILSTIGKIPGSLFVGIGTRASSPDHPWERLLKNSDYSQIHCATEKDSLFTEKTILKACPSAKFMPHLLTQIKREAVNAKSDKQARATYMALRLNMGCPDHDEEHKLLIDPSVWESIETTETPPADTPWVLGLDVGSTESMCGAAKYCYLTGHLDAFGLYGTEPPVAERSQQMGFGNMLVRMHEEGDLILAGEEGTGRVADISAMLNEVLRRWPGVPPSVITCDSWRYDSLCDKLRIVNFPMSGVQICKRRWGWYDGNADVTEFTTAALTHKLKPRKSLAIRASVGASRVKYDSSSNRQMDKRKLDDIALACVLACGVGERLAKRPQPKAFDIIGCKAG